MLKSFLICFLCLHLHNIGLSQPPTQPAISTYTYHSPSTDKESWQRLNLWLSSSYVRVTASSMGADSSIIYASRSLGMSRLPVTAEGIDDPQLISQAKWFDQRDPGKGVAQLSKVSGKKHLELMILLGAYYVFEPDNYRRHKDSVEYFLKKALNESKMIKEKGLGRLALCLLVKLYTQGGDTTNGNAAFNLLIRECKDADDKKTEARALLYSGLFTAMTQGTAVTQTSFTDLIQHRTDCLIKAREIYQVLNDKESEIVVLTNMAYYKAGLSFYEAGHDILVKVLNLEQSIGYPYTHYTTDNLAFITENQGKFGEPLKYALQTIRSAEAAKDSIGWSAFYGRLGTLYFAEGQREEESLKWMLKSLDRYVVDKEAGIYQNLFNIVSVMNGLPGKENDGLELMLKISKKVPPTDPDSRMYYNLTFAMCYLNLKKYNLAEQYVFAAETILKGLSHESFSYSSGKTLVNTTLGAIYFADHQYVKSRKYLEQYIADSTRMDALANDIIIYRQLIHIDSVFNDASSGVKHYKLYTQLLDSNFRVSKVRQAEELQVLYQTKEKQDSITLLHQQAKLEQANLKQATLTKNMTIGGIIVALVIAGLLYRQSRLRKKNNEVVTNKNELLEHLLTEKEWLLKEIHHRVKNNLQIVMSLLNSQTAYIDNEPALSAIHDSQHRVHAMSLIHQKLYNTENVSSIDMSSYIRELVTYLSECFNTGQRIRFEYNIIPLEMDVSQAVPLGLILNEAITNSIKYAFPDNRTGIINISLSNNTANHYLLCIADNGIGIPVNFSNKKPGSLGMSLMAGLSEDLDGNFVTENNNGTIIRISFVHDTTISRSGSTGHLLLPVIR